jgi:hypothetical protein
LLINISSTGREEPIILHMYMSILKNMAKMRAPIRCELLVMHAVYGPGFVLQSSKKTINNYKSLSLRGVVNGALKFFVSKWKGAF